MDLSQPEIRRPLLPNLDEAMKREEFGARDWTPLLPLSARYDRATPAGGVPLKGGCPVLRVLALTVCCLLAAFAPAAAPIFAPAADEVEPPSPYVNLKPKANHNLKDDFGIGRYPGNNLAGLPTGQKTLAGVKFRIDQGMIRLGNDKVNAKHQKVEGVKIGRKVGKLHFLHGTEHSAGDGAVIARYVVHYSDKTKAEVEVAYGKDVVDWWAYPAQVAPTTGKVAWEGENEPAKGFDAKIKLYRMSWKNPHPKKKVVSLDFVATATDTPVLPFCVAITAEK
jgi:hypothetical protein